MTPQLPNEWATKKPIERYETQFLYVGLSRYDTTKKTLSSLFRTPEGMTIYTESLYTGSLARCYASESVTMTIYSHSPRVWTETTEANTQTAFVQTMR
jgi:hypothetical protein